ncbi:DotU family type IV/VI secretion system protein [Paracidobacterium acidisoli]|uniref:DotU family type IV/VI secretion system protein n=1 Tax=Paracidobacterium acidisoli TaxID=2303751 RepID=A0A372IQZ4_9BACT|nr:DotU family type IV/VI secretion system protein [Paracidobacterium acidisoli]MBT9330194.1 DotU family type IV/VI secretion system protein [Paracidobacterium acidisoli]
MVPARVNSLALSFQEALTAILRVRFQRQQVQDSESFRTQMRRALQAAMQESRAMGYSSETVQMGVFAAVAYLDESVLNLQNPVFADWARRPLQEELFGGHMAGETFFLNLRNLLGQQDSAEVADALELYCLCLLMGYRGRYAFGDTGELHLLLRQAREKIQRVRGQMQMIPPSPVPEVKPPRAKDSWSRGLLITTCILAVLTLLAFGGFELALSSGISQIQTSSLVAR